MKKHFTILAESIIIGYIDAYDHVHSQQFHLMTKDEIPTHEDLYGKVLKGWRWDFNNGLKFSVLAGSISSEDADLVREHLNKKYRIPFYENGFHDVMFISRMIDKEESL